MKVIFILIFVFSTQLLAQNDKPTYSKLQSYNIDPKQITVSGISSGAFMASQLGVAYSKTISGYGSIAGGIYWCAEGNKDRATGDCMKNPAALNSDRFIDKAKALASSGEIDPLDNLKKQKVFIFAGTKDTVIKPIASDKLYEFVTQFTTPNLVKYEKTVPAAHGFPTIDYGSSCGLGFLPWILKCNYDGAGEILSVMYDGLNPKTNVSENNLIAYDQSEFGGAATPLFENGWVYVPMNCQKGQKCKLHVALHGCQQSPDYVQDQFAKHAGFNEWAESNDIVILYPQSAKLSPDNPFACWDWYGFTGQSYMTKSGSQMKAIKAMIDRLQKRGKNRS